MPIKDPEERKRKHKEYSKRWYEKNKELSKARVRANKKKKRVEWQEYKATLSCANCGFSHPAVIDFHHIIRGPDMEKVNTLANKGLWGKARKEAEKCVPLCSNCHRILHYEERNSKANRKAQTEESSVVE